MHVKEIIDAKLLLPNQETVCFFIKRKDREGPTEI